MSKHHPERLDCSGCHMPREKSADVAHEQVTDHRIQRRPGEGPVARGGELTVVGGGIASDRDLGLAYFELAERGGREAGQKAMSLLQQAQRSGQGEADPELHTALGLLDQISGDAAGALHEYRLALLANPSSSVAAGDLAILQARSGDVKTAIQGLEWVSMHDPGDTAAGRDLAMIECAVGDPQAAIKAWQRLLEFSPDDQKAREQLAALKTNPNRCKR